LTKEDQLNPSEPANSRSLVHVDVTIAKIDLRGIERLKGVFNNAVKAISRGIGDWLEPNLRVRNAKADRLVANEKAQGIIDLAHKFKELTEMAGQSGMSPEALHNSRSNRAISYLIEDAVRRQSAREKLAEAVVSEMISSPPEQDTDLPIDDDWLTHFWKMSENITNEQIRFFLARLLAREVAQPGAISPLTLNVLSTMTPHVADRFEHFCRLSIREAGNVFVIHPNVFNFQNIGPLDMFGISYDDLYELEAYGLIRSAETIMYNFTVAEGAPPTPIDYAGRAAALNLSGVQMHQLRFTRAGKELRGLLTLSPVPEYTQMLRTKFSAGFIFSDEG
jgi:hypothetical protein